jgi:hypothetical protein
LRIVKIFFSASFADQKKSMRKFVKFYFILKKSARHFTLCRTHHYDDFPAHFIGVESGIRGKLCYAAALNFLMALAQFPAHTGRALRPTKSSQLFQAFCQPVRGFVQDKGVRQCRKVF